MSTLSGLPWVMTSYAVSFVNARRPSDSMMRALIEYLLRGSMSARLYWTLNPIGTWPGPEMVWLAMSGAEASAYDTSRSSTIRVAPSLRSSLSR